MFCLVTYPSVVYICNLCGGAFAKKILTHLSGEVRRTVKSGSNRADYLHFDQLGSVIGISNNTGSTAEQRAYHPFGEISWEQTFDATLTDEAKGFIPLSCFDCVKTLPRQRANATTPTRVCSISTPATTTPSWGCSSNPIGSR